MSTNCYLRTIDRTSNIDALNDIVETAAYDETITHAEYCQIYQYALARVNMICD